MSVEEALDALARLEQRVLADQVKVKVKGVFRPRVVLQASDGDVLCEIRSGLVFFGFPHQARCRVLETNISIWVTGFFEGSFSLLANGSSLLGVDHRPFSSRYLARDWEGVLYQLHRRGRPWDRQFELAEAVPGESLVRLGFAPLRCESSLSISPQTKMKPGVTVGVALLLYYNWYLSLRLATLSTGGAGG